MLSSGHFNKCHIRPTGILEYPLLPFWYSPDIQDEIVGASWSHLYSSY